MAPKASPNGSEIVPKRLQNRSRSRLGGLLAMVPLFGPFFCTPFGLLERSWTPPGPIQSALERLSDAPRRVSRQVSAVLGSKRLPKRSPKGSQIEPRRRLILKTWFLQKQRFLRAFSLVFEVPGSLLGAKSGSKMRSESRPRRRGPRKASWNPLGALLEALGAEKKCLGELLEPLGTLL